LAQHGDKLYLDLANEQGAAVEVDADGWRIVKQPPVYFRRAPGMLPLPDPKADGQLDLLPKLFGLDPRSEEAMFLIAWLVMTLHPSGPYPVLNLRGEQGSRKTTLTEMLRRVIDPNIAPTRQPSADEEAIILAARNGHIVALDNLSFIPAWLSDILCRLSTGSGFGRRTLYRDSEETLYYLKRPVILNGITEIVTRGDLLDRLISAELPVVHEGNRKAAAQVWQDFDKQRPLILGALLDAASTALRRLPDINLQSRPRMADFAEWIEAASPALGWEPGEFLSIYAEQRDNAVSIELEASPVASALLAYLGEYESIGAKDSYGNAIDGLSAEAILLSLTDQHTEYGRKRPVQGWPDNGMKLGWILKRIAPAMRKRGWEITQVRRKDGRKWRVEHVQAGDALGDALGDAFAPGDALGGQGDALPSPKASPPNLLTDDALSQNRVKGDACDALNTLSSVRCADEIDKQGSSVEDREKQASQASQASPQSSRASVFHGARLTSGTCSSA
jgi:hypothetical protein